MCLTRSFAYSVAMLLLCCPVHADTGVDATTRARALHERLLVLDSHLDTPAHFARSGWDIMTRHTYDSDLSQVDYPRMQEGGLDGGFWAIYTPQGPRTPEGEQAARDQALQRAVLIHEMVAKNNQHFALAFTADDAARIAGSGKRVVYLSIENGYPLGHDTTLLKTFYELGVRVFGFVHFKNNDLADSSTDPGGPEWKGLSPLGKQLIVQANRLGIVVDASHASDDVLDQLIELSKTPVLLTHSGCKAAYAHPRNIDDARLRKLAASGGVIQINSYSEYVIPTPVNPDRQKALAALFAQFGRPDASSPESIAALARGRTEIDRKYPVPRATLDDFMKHLLHALQVAGPDHVGIGLDWDGGGGVTGMEDVAALPKITERLLQAGYSEQDLAKIWSGNLLRVLRAAEEYKARIAH